MLSSVISNRASVTLMLTKNLLCKEDAGTGFPVDSASQEGDSVVPMVRKQEEKNPLGGNSGGWW